MKANDAEGLRLAIRKKRMLAGITIRELARELNVSKSWVGLREYGKTQISGQNFRLIVETIDRIARRRMAATENAKTDHI